MKNKMFNGFYNSIVKGFLITLLIYLVGMVLMFYISLIVLSRYTWYGDEPFYPIMSWISNNRLTFGVLCFCIGIIVIFFIYWRKAVGLISAVISASEQLAVQDDVFITLPPLLKQIESRMNELKQSSMRNRQLVKDEQRRKNDLIVFLAHDLKTPLTSVVGYLTLLKDAPDMDVKQREKYTHISFEKAQRLEELINEFFEITRFNLQNITLEKNRLNLSLMLRQLTDEMYPVIGEKHLAFSLEIQPDIMVSGDSNKLARVFDNLYRNAVNYCSPGSEILITSQMADKNVIIRIRNRGAQIPPDQLNNIFEKFYRLDSARTSSTGGAGLGLAIAKEIIELHGGRITAESNEDYTEFSVSLPL